MTSITTELVERDESGNLTATYVQSGSGSEVPTRIDIIWPPKAKAPWQNLLDVFLPAGYPHSVTNDYLEYQIYDSLQAFSSSIANLLSSRAVLQGIGVGDATASTTGAILLSVLQESTGRIATILFAHKLGTSLEPECKMYRLAADILNDAAIILDCLSPVFPKLARVFILSMSSALRALCGVAAGSSKASLSAHFARWGNLGELNAKDSSQETVISLFGMLAGSMVVSMVSSAPAVWSCLMVLLVIHIATNRAAVRAVSMRTLNRQRANIVFSTLIEDGVVLSPEQVSRQESIFERDGALRWKGSPILGFAQIGLDLRTLLLSAFGRDISARAIRPRTVDLDDLMELYEKEQYLLWYDVASRKVLIALKDQVSNESQLKAWTHGLLVTRSYAQAARSSSGSDMSETARLETLRSMLQGLDKTFPSHISRLKDAGWDLDTAALETRSGFRLSVRSKP